MRENTNQKSKKWNDITATPRYISDEYDRGYKYGFEEIEKGIDAQELYDDVKIFDNKDKFYNGIRQCCLDNGAS